MALFLLNGSEMEEVFQRLGMDQYLANSTMTTLPSGPARWVRQKRVAWHNGQGEIVCEQIIGRQPNGEDCRSIRWFLAPDGKNEYRNIS